MLVFLVFQPYKEDWNNKLDGFILSLIITINGITIYQYFLTMIGQELSESAFIIQYFLSYIPFLWIAGYILHKVHHTFKRARNRTTTGIPSYISSAELQTEAADNFSNSDTGVEQHISELSTTESLPPEEVPLLGGDEND